MANITRRRTGEFLRKAFELLWDQPEGLPAQEVLDHIGKTTVLTEYERGFYSSNPNSPRYEKIIRFATVDLVKAGWLVKNKGRWNLTEEGRKAYKKYTEPEAFYKEAVRLYHEWKKNRPAKEISQDAVEEEVVEATFTFEEAEEKAWQQVVAHLNAITPYEFQELAADLLRAMGYHVNWVAPPGKDYGVDIVAYTDPLGANTPRIKVQVKHRPQQAVTVEGSRAFLSVIGSDDMGLFISSGGFTKDAWDQARTQERRKVTLLDLENLFDLWVEHFDNLSQDARRRLPLKPIYFIAPNP